MDDIYYLYNNNLPLASYCFNKYLYTPEVEQFVTWTSTLYIGEVGRLLREQNRFCDGKPSLYTNIWDVI